MLRACLYTIFLCLIGCGYTPLFAQQITQSRTEKLSGTVPYCIASHQNGITTILMQWNSMYAAKKYNSTMAELSTIDLPDINPDCKMLEVVRSNEGYTAYSVVGNSIFAQQFDTNFIVQSANTEQLNYEPGNTNNEIHFAASKNKKYLLAFILDRAKNDDIEINYVALNGTMREKISWQKINLGQSTLAVSTHGYVSNNGTVFFTTALTNTAGINNYFVASSTSPQAKTINLPLAAFTHELATINEENNSLCFFLQKISSNATSKEIIQGTLQSNNTLSLDTIAPSIAQAHSANPDPEIETVPKLLVMSHNNNALLLYENKSVIDAIVGADTYLGFNGITQRVNRVVKRYYNGNIQLYYSNAAAKQYQHAAIYKEQWSENDGGYYSGFASLPMRDAVAVIFFSKDRRNNLQLASIAQDQSVQYAILNDSKTNLQYAVLQEAVQVSSNTLIVPCKKQNMISFAKIQF